MITTKCEEKLTLLCSGIASPTRRRILWMIGDGVPATEFTARLGLHLSTVSSEIGRLVTLDLVELTERLPRRRYRLTCLGRDVVAFLDELARE
jgi:DNA-binding transcriptional ArsR family regulator